jgi:hypothetical protein
MISIIILNIRDSVSFFVLFLALSQYIYINCFRRNYIGWVQFAASCWQIVNIILYYRRIQYTVCSIWCNYSPAAHLLHFISLPRSLYERAIGHPSHMSRLAECDQLRCDTKVWHFFYRMWCIFAAIYSNWMDAAAGLDLWGERSSRSIQLVVIIT